jgi:pimeloyl-ACP methyl ester carboxylesterase
MKVVVNDQLVNYEEEGKGKVILLLHGWGADLHNFDELSAKLSKQYRVIRMDFPGFGGSPLPPKEWNRDDYARLTVGLIKKLRIKKVHAVIAHSFGGGVVIKAVRRRWYKFDRIILLASGGIRHSNSMRQRGFKVVAKTGKLVTKLPGLSKFHDKWRGQLYDKAGASDYVNAGDLRKIFLKVINEDVQDAATYIRCPTLLVWGEDDMETPLDDAAKFNEKIKGSQLVVIPEAGHFVHNDQFEKVYDEIKRFIKK